MANRQIAGLTAEASPARTEVVPIQDAAAAAEAKKITVANLLALALAADISDASANGRSLITAANYAAMRTLLSLVPGTDVAAIASPTFTGTPAAPTAAAATNTTQLATTAFVTTAANLKADLASPTLTGTPAAPTAATTTSTTQLATTAFVQQELASAVNYAFKTLTVSGQSDVVADSNTDTLTLAAGSNITLTTNASTDTVTIAASGSTGIGTVQEEGSNLTQRATINFVGGGFTAADDAANTRTNVTLATALNNLAAGTDIAVVDGGTGASTGYAGLDNLTLKGSDIASATTTDIGAATGHFVHITGTTTITGLGTKTAGVFRFLRFAGALTLTHNSTSLILPGAANITTVANDTAIFVSEGSGNWRCLAYSPSYLTLAANEYAALNTGGTAMEARLDKRAYGVSLSVTADGTYVLPPWPDIPATAIDVQSQTWGGTCSIKLKKAGSDFTAYSSAVAQTTTLATTTCTEAFTKGQKMELVISSSSSLTGVALTINAKRTAA